MPYVSLFFSLQDMPDLCPKGTDLGVKASAPSYPLTLPLPLYQVLTTEQAEGRGIPPGKDASVSKKVQTTPVPTQPQTTLVSIGTQTKSRRHRQPKLRMRQRMRKRMRMRKSRFP